MPKPPPEFHTKEEEDAFFRAHPEERAAWEEANSKRAKFVDLIRPAIERILIWHKEGDDQEVTSNLTRQQVKVFAAKTIEEVLFLQANSKRSNIDREQVQDLVEAALIKIFENESTCKRAALDRQRRSNRIADQVERVTKAEIDAVKSERKQQTDTTSSNMVISLERFSNGSRDRERQSFPNSGVFEAVYEALQSGKMNEELLNGLSIDLVPYLRSAESEFIRAGYRKLREMHIDQLVAAERLLPDLLRRASAAAVDMFNSDEDEDSTDGAAPSF